MASLTLGKKVCFTCSTIIGKNKKSINCLTCGGWFHARTACMKYKLVKGLKLNQIV